MSLLFILVGAAVLAGVGVYFHKRLAALEAVYFVDAKGILADLETAIKSDFARLEAKISAVKADASKVEGTITSVEAKV